MHVIRGPMLISFAIMSIVVLVASKVTTRELKKPILSLTIILPTVIAISIFCFYLYQESSGFRQSPIDLFP